MVDPNTRQGKRTPVTLKIKFKSETLEQFIERYAVDVSQGGIFIRTKEPLAVGTQMKFEFQLRDASPLIAGEGTVVWTRENDPSRPAIAPGMGVRFDRLADGSQTVLERILAEKAKQAPQRPLKETTKPPLFTDTPTRVAPAPIQEALLGGGDGKPPRTRADSQETPLPKPMPFHSDADDFSEEAFEEATKVRALDELVAQTAVDDNGKPLPEDELAARRALFKDGDKPAEAAKPAAPAGPTTAGMPVGVVPPFAAAPIPVTPADAKTPTESERDSAPGLPSPPEATKPKLLDTTPSPRESGSTLPPAKTQLGVGPATAKTTGKQPALKDAATVPSGVHAIQQPAASSGSLEAVPPPKRPSVMPIVLGIIFVVAAAGAAVWFFVLREPAVESMKPGTGSGSVGSAGSANVGNAGSDTPAPGSNGSAEQMTNANPGSAGSADVGTNGSGSAAPAAGPTLDTVIASSVDKATVEVEGTDQKGPSPFTAKLEKDKPYKVKVSAPGYLAGELEVKGGQAKVTQKLEPKKYLVTINVTPAGAAVAVDGVVGSKTPIELKTAPKKAVTVRVAKPGFKPQTITIAPDKWTEDATTMSFTQDVTLAVAPVVNTPPPPDKGSGSAPPPDKGSGEAQPDKGSNGGGGEPTPPPAPPPASPPAGGGEPTPGWAPPAP